MQNWLGRARDAGRGWGGTHCLRRSAERRYLRVARDVSLVQRAQLAIMTHGLSSSVCSSEGRTKIPCHQPAGVIVGCGCEEKPASSAAKAHALSTRFQQAVLRLS